MAIIEVKVPQLSESVSEATLLDWHKKEGESVARDENLIDIETDKVVLELPAPADGVLVKVIKKSRESVGSGEIIAQIDTEARGGVSVQKEESKPAPEKARPATPAVMPAAVQDGIVTVGEKNTTWDVRNGVFLTFFEKPAVPKDKPVITGFGEAGKLVDQWYKDGTAAGNGVGYLNGNGAGYPNGNGYNGAPNGANGYETVNGHGNGNHAPNGAGYGKPYPPEKGVDLAAVYKGKKDAEARWQEQCFPTTLIRSTAGCPFGLDWYQPLRLDRNGNPVSWKVWAHR